MGIEKPLFFECAGDALLGVLHHPGSASLDVGLLLVVGGPQYRVGSHRQFVLLARALAAAGIPVFRFDYRGMGDSAGDPRDFEHIGLDIRAALDCFSAHCSGLRGVVLWGLCDAATANAFYTASDSRVLGQIALNPWVRTSSGAAQAFIRHYYLQRFISRAFWHKVFSGKWPMVPAVRDFFSKLGHSREMPADTQGKNRAALPERLLAAQQAAGGPTLVILSGQDLTAREYDDRVSRSPAWSAWMVSPKVTLYRLDAADHTFSRAVWRDQVAEWSRDWMLAHFSRRG